MTNKNKSARVYYSVIILLLSFVLLASKTDKSETGFVKSNFILANKQLMFMAKEVDRKPLVFPRTTDDAGKMITTDMYEWTSGFFPGSLWYLYEYTHNDTDKSLALEWTERLEPLQYYTDNHDLGFMTYCSYGNAFRLTGNEKYKMVLVQAARSLMTRFNAKVGSIKSWNGFQGWHGNNKQRYCFPVIIDNMMNLELLFFASKVTADTTFKHVAMTHALTQMKNHIRKDYSSYHVVCYDSVTGKVLTRQTAQGYADNSTWSRGQGWGIYGFTMCYRFSKDPRFLRTAQGMADWFLDNKNLPVDKIPYWDFNAGQTGYTPGDSSHALALKSKPRDASAAAVVASALMELSTYTAVGKAEKYKKAAVQILHSLASPTYRAALNTNANFILMHSTGSAAHGVEIDKPLVYADYYFLEALERYNRLLKGKPVVDVCP